MVTMAIGRLVFFFSFEQSVSILPMTDNTHIPVPHRNSSQKELGLIRKIYCLLKVGFFWGFFYPPEFKGTMLPSTLFPPDTAHNAHNRVTKKQVTQRW